MGGGAGRYQPVTASSTEFEQFRALIVRSGTCSVRRVSAVALMAASRRSARAHTVISGR